MIDSFSLCFLRLFVHEQDACDVCEWKPAAVLIAAFFPGVRELCKEFHWLFMFLHLALCFFWNPCVLPSSGTFKVLYSMVVNNALCIRLSSINNWQICPWNMTLWLQSLSVGDFDVKAPFSKRQSLKCLYSRWWPSSFNFYCFLTWFVNGFYTEREKCIV